MSDQSPNKALSITGIRLYKQLLIFGTSFWKFKHTSSNDLSVKFYERALL